MTNVPATTSSYGGGLGSNSWFGSRGEIYCNTVNLNNGWMACGTQAELSVMEAVGTTRKHVQLCLDGYAARRL